MGAQWTIQEIAHIESDFSEKFGIPRQSGLVEELRARIVFDPAFRDENAVRGLAEFSHIWLIWGFSANAGRWSATVKPPRLGGNTRIGVFATRSPFRPKSLGLSCVRLLRVEPQTPQGPVTRVFFSPALLPTMAIASNSRTPSLTALNSAVRSAQFVAV